MRRKARTFGRRAWQRTTKTSEMHQPRRIVAGGTQRCGHQRRHIAGGGTTLPPLAFPSLPRTRSWPPSALLSPAPSLSEHGLHARQQDRRRLHIHRFPTHVPRLEGKRVTEKTTPRHLEISWAETWNLNRSNQRCPGRRKHQRSSGSVLRAHVFLTPLSQLVARASDVPNGVLRTPIVLPSEVIKSPLSVNRELMMQSGLLWRSDVILVTTRNKMVLGRFGISNTVSWLNCSKDSLTGDLELTKISQLRETKLYTWMPRWCQGTISPSSTCSVQPRNLSLREHTPKKPVKTPFSETRIGRSQFFFLTDVLLLWLHQSVSAHVYIYICCLMSICNYSASIYKQHKYMYTQTHMTEKRNIHICT